MLRTLAALTIGAALAAVACATEYQFDGPGGGYADERIDDSHYRVSLKGNGLPTADRGWYFWSHRCAELTKQKGYTHFSLKNISYTKSPVEQEPVTWRREAIVSMFKAPLPGNVVLLDAQMMLDDLDAYIKSDGTMSPPPREDVYRRAVSINMPRAKYEFGGAL